MEWGRREERRRDGHLCVTSNISSRPRRVTIERTFALSRGPLRRKSDPPACLYFTCRNVTNTEVGSPSPQRPRFLRQFTESPDYILEPSWQGVRALIEVGPNPSARGYGGRPLNAPRELLEAVAAVAACDTALIDGVIVRDFGAEGELEAGEGDDAYLRRPAIHDVFVAVDLLEVDGVSLLDAPLLERKRHLAGLIRPSQNVRVSPFVRRGMRAWRDTLQGQGFRRFVLKKVNSRYRPGETNDDWLQVEKL